MGYAVYRDGEMLVDGYHQFTATSPLHYLEELATFLWKMDDAFRLDALATESMFVDVRRGGNRAALLNVSVVQMEAWCVDRVRFLRYQNSTVKRLVAGRGGAEKEEVYRAVERHMSEAAKALPKVHRYDVSDAHAIAWTAIVSKYGKARPAPKKSRAKK
jgi:Holliday junction resolvasome RuvABC endonuclease subunit